MRDGKLQLISQKYFSVKLLSLFDYMLHKSPYWSYSNYDKRVPDAVRTSFMEVVANQHKKGHKELEGNFHLV